MVIEKKTEEGGLARKERQEHQFHQFHHTRPVETQEEIHVKEFLPRTLQQRVALEAAEAHAGKHVCGRLP